ncbi:MAG: hypothetical protein DRP78_03725 [Candidatus Omnitrophota bacterium]|nr:MAG: hypothetical protein DRP78_03725 [Candidatus Omnitrophota bacterium]
MRIVKFLTKSQQCWGLVEGEKIKILDREPFAGIVLSGESIGFDGVKLLAPASPTKIVLAGLNYKEHALELGMQIPLEPIIFLKPVSSLIAYKENIIYHPGIGRLDYEAELALVIKKEAKFITKDCADDYILGYTCLNDVTARDIQQKEGQWTRAKSFDSFCPFGPWLETDLNPMDLEIKLYLNGSLKQCAKTSDFIFSPAYLVSFISQVMTLMPGDIISTGTPKGVGKMEIGDCARVDIEHIGRLENCVKGWEKTG